MGESDTDELTLLLELADFFSVSVDEVRRLLTAKAVSVDELSAALWLQKFGPKGPEAQGSTSCHCAD